MDFFQTVIHVKTKVVKSPTADRREFDDVFPDA